MGCGSSKNSGDPEAEKIDWNNDASIDDEFKEEEEKVMTKRKVFDKTTKTTVEVDAPKHEREFDFFEGADAGAGEQFMAVRPYEGAIQEPEEHNEEKEDAPELGYELEYVYGYRAEDSRMNCFYNEDGNVVYFTAALGVILNKSDNTQKFFGGGQVDNTSKKVARDDLGHTNDITALDISEYGKFCATGQWGSVPVAFVWDAVTGEKKSKFKLKKGMREVTAIGICPNNKMVAMTDNSNDHNLWVFDVDTQKKIECKKTGGQRIYHIAWSPEKGENVIATAGSKHIAFWDMNNTFKERSGIYGKKGKPTSHCAVAWDDQGNCYTGGANSHIYHWAKNIKADGEPTDRLYLQSHYDVHGRGFVWAIKWQEGKVISGAKDGKVVVSNPKTKEAERTIDVGSLVRSVDMKGDSILAGLRNGTIVEITANDQITDLMRSHSDGEAWGLDINSNGTIVSSGDDNKIYTWSIKDRKNTGSGEICDEDSEPKKGGASSLTTYAPSKCARAISINEKGNGHVAIGHNDGRVTIRGGVDDLNKIVHTLKDAEEWIEVIEYSPCGGKMAVGSHDDDIYVYDTNDYKLIGKGTAHNSFIVSIDWSEDSSYIRSVCGAHELLFFTVQDNIEHDNSGASNTKGLKWNTSHAKFGWSVTGIFPKGTDGTHINDVDFSNDGELIVTGDDYGLVNVWRNPARKGAKPISLRGHSEHVIRTRFAEDDSYIFSIGGYDKTIMQWKRK